MRAGAFAALLLCLGNSALAKDGDVAVVVSSRAGAFGAALRAVEASLGPRARVFDISALGRQKATAALPQTNAAVTLAIGPIASQVAVNAVPDRPLVFCLLPNAKRRGLDAKSGVYGVPLAVDTRSLLSTLRSALPGVTKVSAIYDPAESAKEVKRAVADAKKVGILLMPQPVGQGAELSKSISHAFRRSDAVWLLPDRAVSSRESLRYILLKSFETEVPVVVAFDAYARQGAFLAVMPDPAAHGRAAAAMARAVADGTAVPRSTTPEEVLTVINMRTASRLGLRVPDAFLRRASSVIK